MSDSVRPHRRQPTRLPHPWDSPGKNTGVGCHFLLQCMKVKSEKWKWSRSVVSDSYRPHGLQPNRLLCPWDFPSKSTGVGCHCLLQNIQKSWGNTIFVSFTFCYYHQMCFWFVSEFFFSKEQSFSTAIFPRITRYRFSLMQFIIPRDIIILLCIYTITFLEGDSSI